jgi:hypothetical protein
MHACCLKVSDHSHVEGEGEDAVCVCEHSPPLGLDTEVVLPRVRHQDAVA